MSKTEIVNHIKEFYISARFLPTFPFLIITIFYVYSILYINNLDINTERFFLYISKMIVGFIFGMLHNNLIDYEIDKKFKPHKIGLSKKNLTIYTYIFGTGFLSLIYKSYIVYGLNNYTYLAISEFMLIYFYTDYLKRIPLVKNIVVSIYTIFIMLFIFLNEYIDTNKCFLLIFPISVIFTMREIILDIGDINEDKKNNLITLPILVGDNNIYLTLRIIYTCMWLISFKMCVNYNLYPLQIMINTIYFFYNMFYIDKKNILISVVFYQISWTYLLLTENYNLSILNYIISNLVLISSIYFYKNISNNENDKVLKRKILHVSCGCLILSCNVDDRKYLNLILLISSFIFYFGNFINFRLGVEKYNTNLFKDIGIKNWVYFSLLWNLLIFDKNNYYDALVFYICDPSAAIIGKLMDTKINIKIYKQKTIFGSLSIAITSYILLNNIFVSILITLSELYGDKYDNYYIGMILLGNKFIKYIK
jgi:4-hydroxybenzoate polyprenyltransferase